MATMGSKEIYVEHKRLLIGRTTYRVAVFVCLSDQERGVASLYVLSILALHAGLSIWTEGPTISWLDMSAYFAIVVAVVVEGGVFIDMFGEMEVQHNVCTIHCYRFSLGAVDQHRIEFLLGT